LARVCGEVALVPWSTRETVAMDTPASCATEYIVVARLPCLRVVIRHRLAGKRLQDVSAYSVTGRT
jgi:hypothetical protein